MNANTANGGGTAAASAPLAENEHVSELLSILKDNGRDASGLTALLDHVKGMEEFVKMAETKIAEMKTQLDEMKEVQDHPIKAALQNAIKSLEAKVKEMKAHIADLKNSIVSGCKNAVAAFKEKGIGALDKLASFFKIKSGLQIVKDDAVMGVDMSKKAIAKIETFSQEYHKAGRGLKNMARIIIGKKPIDAAKESGRLARAMCAPYRGGIAINLAIQNQVNKMAAALDRLEQKAEAKREAFAESRQEKRGDSAEKKPSLMERLNTNKELVRQKELEKPPLARATKAQGIEV